MGTFSHPLTIIGPTGDSQTIDAVVDPDRMFGVVPAQVLDRLAVAPLDRPSVDAAGERRGVAQVQAELDGHHGWIMVVFGNAGETPCIGRHTLDSCILDYDEEKHEFIPKVVREIRHF